MCCYAGAGTRCKSTLHAVHLPRTLRTICFFASGFKLCHLVCKKSASKAFSDERNQSATKPFLFVSHSRMSGLQASVTAQMRSLLCLCFLSLSGRLLGFSKRLHFAKSQWLPILGLATTNSTFGGGWTPSPSQEHTQPSGGG